MRVYFYDAVSGIFTGRSLTVSTGHLNYSPGAIKANTPAGQEAFEGEADVLAQRVDIETGKLVDYQPPQPSAEHEWDEQVRRWALTPEAAQRQEQRRAALAQIHALESGQQARAVREAVLGLVGAADRLRSLDERIAALRAQL